MCDGDRSQCRATTTGVTHSHDVDVGRGRLGDEVGIDHKVGGT